MGTSHSVVCPIEVVKGKINEAQRKRLPCALLQGSKLKEAMMLLKDHPILQEPFFEFFQSGRWINQFLSTNPNMVSFSNYGTNPNSNQFLNVEEISLFSSLLEKSLDTYENMLSLFLASSFPIFMQSSEFQLWLETFKDEEEAVEKEVIHMDTMGYRRHDEIDEEEFVSSGKSNLELKHRRKSNPNHEAHIVRAETEVRMRSMINEVLKFLTTEKLSAFARPRHWMERINDLLNSVPYPVIIARTKISKHGSGVFKNGMYVVSANDAYTTFSSQKSSDVVGRIFTNVIMKDSHVVSKEVLLPPTSTADSKAEGLLPYKLTLETKKKDGSIVKSYMFVKPVHHVIADPEYNYLIAVQCDFANESAPIVTADSSEIVSNKSQMSCVTSSKKHDMISAKTILTISSMYQASPRVYTPSLATESMDSIASAKENTIDNDRICQPAPFYQPLLKCVDDILSPLSGPTKVVCSSGECGGTDYSDLLFLAAKQQGSVVVNADMIIIEDILNLLSLILF